MSFPELIITAMVMLVCICYVNIEMFVNGINVFHFLIFTDHMFIGLPHVRHAGPFFFPEPPLFMRRKIEFLCMRECINIVSKKENIQNIYCISKQIISLILFKNIYLNLVLMSLS